jgi:hypothetical protein
MLQDFGEFTSKMVTIKGGTSSYVPNSQNQMEAIWRCVVY